MASIDQTSTRVRWPGGLLRPRYVVPAALLLLFALAPQILRDDYYLQVLIMILFSAYMATAWNLVCGYAGQLSLGHAALVGIGGYVSTLIFINLRLSPWIGMFAGAGLAVVVGVAIGYPCFRLRGPYFALTTIALAEVLRIWVENTDRAFGIDIKASMGLLVPLRGDAPLLFQFVDKASYYYIILVMLLLVLYVAHRMQESKVGFYLAAIRSDQDAAEAIGINATRIKLIAMALSALFTALGGTYYAQLFRYVNPSRILGIDLSVEMALTAIVGGQATVFGPTLGAFLLTPAAEFSRAVFGGRYAGVHLVLYGLVLVLAIYYLPKGINGLAGRWYSRLIDWLERHTSASATERASEASHDHS